LATTIIRLPRSGTSAFGSFLEKNKKWLNNQPSASGIDSFDSVFVKRTTTAEQLAFNKGNHLSSSAKRNKCFWFFSRKEQNTTQLNHLQAELIFLILFLKRTITAEQLSFRKRGTSL
jgi:hypothetical protein